MQWSRANSETPQEYKATDFGNVVSFDAIKDDPEGYADVFCEGSAALKSLLIDLWSKDIETFGCCAGHECVHTYVKDPIFGSEPQFIDRETYLAHSYSKRYHDYVSEAQPYMYFRADQLGGPDGIRHAIDSDLKSIFPFISFQTDAADNRCVLVCLDRYVPSAWREHFFSSLSQAINRLYDRTRDTYKENLDSFLDDQSKTTSLKERILYARERSIAQFEGKANSTTITKENELHK